MQKNKEVIFETIRKMAVIKGGDIAQERIELYTEVLSKYDTKKVLEAIKTLTLESRFFPDISEFLKIIDPNPDKDTLANDMVGAIIEAIAEFGSYNSEGAAEYLGVKAWHVVERSGGWQTLCQTTYNQLNTLRAQLRDLAKSVEVMSKISPDQLEAPYQKRGLAKFSFEELGKLEAPNGDGADGKG